MSARIDGVALHAALDVQREARGMSWRKLAAEAGVSPSLLSRLGNGVGLEADGFAALVQWLGVPPERFMPGFTPAPVDLLIELAMVIGRADLDPADREFLLTITTRTVGYIESKSLKAPSPRADLPPRGGVAHPEPKRDGGLAGSGCVPNLP